MISANEICKSLYGKISKSEKVAFISAIVCGFLAHGYMITNKISFHDDLSGMFGYGRTLASERWTLDILAKVGRYISVNVSLAWYNGIISLLCIAVSAMLIVELFEIREELYAVLVAAVLVAFPTVAATFAYMFTASAYFTALLLMCIAVFLLKRDSHSLLRIISSGILIAVSLGIYQAYIGVFTSLALLFLLKLTICENRDYRNILKKILYILISLIIGIGLYLLMNKLLCMLWNQNSPYSKRELSHLPKAVIAAYRQFYVFFKGSFYGINPYIGLQWLMRILLLYTGVGFFYIVFRKKSLCLVNKLGGIILFLLFPLAVNFMYVITLNDVTVHALMLYPLCLIFLLPYVVFSADESRMKNGSHWLVSIGMFFIACFFIKVDNVAYQYSGFMQEEAIAYYTNLVGRIMSCEGYSDELPVAFFGIGTRGIEDSSMTDKSEFHVSLTALEFNMSQVIDDYVYKQYLEMHCGYSPVYIENEEKEKLREKVQIQEMPCYPKDGSIKIIDGVIVVKFSENEG